MKRSVWLFIVISALISTTFSSASVPASSAKVNSEVNARYAEAYGKLPLSFVENKGQLNKVVRYVINGPRASAFFTNTGVTFDLAEALPKKPGSTRNLDPVSQTAVKPEKPVKHVALKMEFAGASPRCRVAGVDKLQGKVNIMKGNDSSKWKTDIPTYKGIIYKDAWKGIDVSYSGNRKQLKYDIIVNPGAKVSDIKLRYSGADKIWLDAKGDLHIKTAVASFTETVPGIHQIKSGRQTALKGGYVLLDKQTVGFKVQGADPRLPIIIDPASDLVYSTFLGGTKGELVWAIAVDDEGCAYITGEVSSQDFPITSGAFNTIHYQEGNIFVTKLNSSGSALVYSTCIAYGSCNAIAVDDEGCAYIAGYTAIPDFPTTPGAFDTSFNEGSNREGFITKLNQSGSGLVYSTLLGGINDDYIADIAVDNAGYMYITGYTESPDFPITPNAFDSDLNTGYKDIDYRYYYDVFAVKLNPSGSSLEYSTLIGSPGDDYAVGIAVDDAGYAYIAGNTESSLFPTTSGAFSSKLYTSTRPINYSFYYDVFVTKLNLTGSDLVYSTVLGGREDDYAWDIAIDDAGCTYITGETCSYDYPTKSGSFDTTGIGYDAFVTKLNSTGSDMVYSSYIGGNNAVDRAYGIGVDDEGCAYITGYTVSDDFPVTSDAYDTTHAAGPVIPWARRYEDAFLTKFNASGSGLEYSTFLGGSDIDETYSIALDNTGGIYITGCTYSFDLPVTPGAFDTSFNGAPSDIGSDDLFVSKFKLQKKFYPDLLLKAGNSSYGFNDIYSNDGSNQIKLLSTSAYQAVNYGFRVQNDGINSDTFKITGTAGGNDWTVKYCDLTTNADVTSQVTGSGWSSGTLTPGATNGVYVIITPNNTVAPESTKTLIITAVSQGDTTKKDVGKAVTTAVATYKPDILIKAGNTSYDCNNIYGTDGSNQTKSQNASIGQTVTYGFRVQNDGNINDTYKITGPAGGNGWTIVYKDLSTNADITSQVTGSGWSSGTLAPGATSGVYVLITPDNTVVSGTVKTLLITAVSQGDSSKKDVCKAVTTAVSTYRTDILMKAGAETSYAFNNIYSTDGSSQTKTLNASVNQKVNYAFRVQNDGINSDTFKVTGPAGSDGWTVKYYDLTTNADVTSLVTGSGWTSGTLAPGATSGVYVFVTPDGTVPIGSEKILTITAVSQSDASTKDVCKAVTRKQ